MLRDREDTFVVVHDDAVPAEDMSTARHLWNLEVRLKADGAVEFLFGVVGDLPDFDPLLSFDSFESGECFEFLLVELCGVDCKSESAHDAFFAIFGAIPS